MHIYIYIHIINAQGNNLRLNEKKTCELILCSKNTKTSSLPAPSTSISRSPTMNVLGVMLDSHLNFGEHIDYVMSSGAQSMYALTVLKSHGMSKVELSKVCRATLI